MTDPIRPLTSYRVVPGLYLLDTNILIHYVRLGPVHDRIEERYKLQSRPDTPLISYVTEAEAWSFAVSRQWGATKRKQLAFLLTTVRRVPIEEPDILNAYVRIDAFCTNAGRELGKNDAWIAATARATGATLLTTDRDFEYAGSALLSVEWIHPTV